MSQKLLQARGVPEDGLYTGTVMHKRYRPKEHAFQYSLYLAFLDTKVCHFTRTSARDVLAASFPLSLTLSQASSEVLNGMWPLAGFDRRAIASLQRSDHAKSEAAELTLDEAVSDGASQPPSNFGRG